MPVYIGIDGGGTKTEAVALGDREERLCSLTGPSTNPRALGFPVALRQLAELLDDTLARPELGGAPCGGLCLGLAGVGLPEERQQVLTMLEQFQQERGLSFPVWITNDAEIGLMGALGKEAGMIAVSGTGSILYGLTPEGQSCRVGGWGHLLGDEGSGYAIGLASIKAVMRSYDGVLPPTRLTGLICEAYGFEDITGLKDYIYKEDIKKKDIAAFARLCIEAAEAGDETASQILETAALELADQAITLVNKNLWFVTADLVMTGSIFGHAVPFRETFMRIVGGAFPHLQLHLSQQSPAYGAALLASRRAARS
ncbi:N-acetylmuramic acid/N-acetylglucosamine kinase [Paenibacillus sp. J31TS4]|uniref:BadF/BadG/BcrA/BcrD ATPase family protein n=1 Tax=Paenibacillus sp. J31TS4 TaxID=2807195 RepID=UPI001B1CB617|nr:BadF/BadG/BcrA/BcrD ATPase family protein [Paenibacillus sp. J31TS4]GIP38772.1 N-acetylmuramic acid/N-acetylglucosamine kinase [Paenibacillus sp. J31TS4]